MHDIEAIALFLAHVIVADEQIHSQELAALEQFTEKHSITTSLKSELDLIFSDLDTKTTVEQVIQRLSSTQWDVHRDTISEGFRIAYIDGYCDPREEALLSKLKDRVGFDTSKYTEIKKEAENTYVTQSKSIHARPRSRLTAVIWHMKRVSLFILPKHLQYGFERISNRLLLAGHEYELAIDSCAAIAVEDFRFIEPQLQRTNGKLHTLNQQIGRILERIKNSKDQDDVAEVLLTFHHQIRDMLLLQINRSQTSLSKKQRATRSYTISFFGKTKAGKSTLHAVLTGTGKEYIGDGRPRVTRYNRVYTWNNIRIIDTPGLFARGGTNDARIAASVIDETDMVCFIVTNDNQTPPELHYLLEQIRLSGKPVIILINVKRQLNTKTYLEEYLKDPHKWYRSKDDKSVWKQVQRVLMFAQTHYGQGNLRVYPVHLLAALLGREESGGSDAAKLYESSHIQDFLDAIRAAIVEEGILRRSQTIIDGTSYMLTSMLSKIDKELRRPVQDKAHKLEEKWRALQQQTQKNYQERMRDMKHVVYAEFGKLRENAHSFASQNYNLPQAQIQQNMNTYLKQQQFEQAISAQVNAVIQKYFDEVMIDLEEFRNDMAAFDQFYLSNMKIKSYSSWNLHDFIDFGSKISGIGILTTVGLTMLGVTTGPLMLIFTAATFVFGVAKIAIGNRSNSATKAINQFHSDLLAAIDQQQESTLQKAQQALFDAHRSAKQTVDSYFQRLIQGTLDAVDKLNAFEQFLEAQVQEINQVFAWRAINYAYYRQRAPVPIDLQQARATIGMTHRHHGYSFAIKYRAQVHGDIARYLSEFLQEQVTITSDLSQAND